MPGQILSITEIARMLGVPHWKVRHACNKLPVAPLRIGYTRAIPQSWLPAIKDALSTDLRRKRPRERLRLSD